MAIVGLDGYARAKASFTPRSKVFVGNAAPIQGPVARAILGSAVYADGKGTIRRLDIDGSVHNLATFPITEAQQQLRFAVSPDGNTILATTITFPPRAANGTMEQPFQQGAHWSVALDRSLNGSTRHIYTRDLGDQYPTAVPTVAGWLGDNALFGVAELRTQQGPADLIAAQGVGPADPSGNSTSGPIGGPECVQQSWSAKGDVLCYNPPLTNGQVRSAGGVLKWSLPPDCVLPNASPQLMWSLSPGGSRVVTNRNVCGADGTVIAVPAAFHPQGWLDDNTVIGTVSDFNGDLGIVRLSDPGYIDDLGFKGEFVGVVKPG